MYIKYTLLLIICACSAVLYHLGGLGKDGAKNYPKVPSWLFNSKVRDLGCSVCAIIALCVLRGGFPVNWITAFSLLGWFLLSWAAVSAYWKGDAVDMKARHWFYHGLGIGLSALPLCCIGITWWLVLIRSVALGLTMMAVSEYFENACAEECSRGALIVATLLII